MKHRTRRPSHARAAQLDLIGYGHQAIAPPKTPEISDKVHAAITWLRIHHRFAITRRGKGHSHIKARGIDRVVEHPDPSDREEPGLARMKPPKIGCEDHRVDQLHRLGVLICSFLNPGGCYCNDNRKPLCANVKWRAEKALEIGLEEPPPPLGRRPKKKRP
jgi:hypothetical protein